MNTTFIQHFYDVISLSSFLIELAKLAKSNIICITFWYNSKYLTKFVCLGQNFQEFQNSSIMLHSEEHKEVDIHYVTHTSFTRLPLTQSQLKAKKSD